MSHIFAKRFYSSCLYDIISINWDLRVFVTERSCCFRLLQKARHLSSFSNNNNVMKWNVESAMWGRLRMKCSSCFFPSDLGLNLLGRLLLGSSATVLNVFHLWIIFLAPECELWIGATQIKMNWIKMWLNLQIGFQLGWKWKYNFSEIDGR